MMHPNATNVTRPPSLVDTVAAGFRTLNQALPALIVPILLDIWYWAGPKISIHPLVDWLRAALDPEAWQLIRSRIDPALLTERLFDLKFTGRLEGQMPFWQRVHTLEPNITPRLFAPATWHVGSWLTLLGVIVVINIVLTLLTALYLLPLADIVRGTTAPRSWLHRVARAWLSQLGVLGIVLSLLIVIGIPLLTVAGISSALSPLLGNIITVFAIAVILWIFFTASFAYDAIVLSGAGPIGAVLASLLVIRTSFWGAAGLHLLSFFILAGLNVIWQNLTGSVPGLILAILSSAYIGAGLTAAHLVFYRDRLPTSAARANRS